MFLCFGHVNLSNRKKFSNQSFPGKIVLCLMIGFPSLFCPFNAHEGLQRVFQVACVHFQYVSVLWTCGFDPQKKFSNQHLLGKKFSVSCLDLQRCFDSFMPPKVLRRSQRTLVGTFNVFLCLGLVNLSHRKSSPTKTCQDKSSLPHVWISKDILPVSCPQRSPGGLKGHLWALTMCYRPLDM